MSDNVRIFGLNLLRTKLALVGPEEFFRQTQIDNWKATSMVTGLKTVKDVLWMRMLEASEGMKLPNGCRWFYYIPFWGSRPKFYRFRTNPMLDCMNLQDFYPAATKWSVHGF